MGEKKIRAYRRIATLAHPHVRPVSGGVSDHPAWVREHEHVQIISKSMAHQHAPLQQLRDFLLTLHRFHEGEQMREVVGARLEYTVNLKFEYVRKSKSPLKRTAQITLKVMSKNPVGTKLAPYAALSLLAIALQIRGSWKMS